MIEEELDTVIILGAQWIVVGLRQDSVVRHLDLVLLLARMFGYGTGDLKCRLYATAT
jgi:hypothetical protein